MKTKIELILVNMQRESIIGIKKIYAVFQKSEINNTRIKGYPGKR